MHPVTEANENASSQFRVMISNLNGVRDLITATNYDPVERIVLEQAGGLVMSDEIIYHPIFEHAETLLVTSINSVGLQSNDYSLLTRLQLSPERSTESDHGFINGHEIGEIERQLQSKGYYTKVARVEDIDRVLYLAKNDSNTSGVFAVHFGPSIEQRKAMMQAYSRRIASQGRVEEATQMQMDIRLNNLFNDHITIATAYPQGLQHPTDISTAVSHDEQSYWHNLLGYSKAYQDVIAAMCTTEHQRVPHKTIMLSPDEARLDLEKKAHIVERSKVLQTLLDQALISHQWDDAIDTNSKHSRDRLQTRFGSGTFNDHITGEEYRASNANVFPSGMTEQDVRDVTEMMFVLGFEIGLPDDIMSVMELILNALERRGIIELHHKSREYRKLATRWVENILIAGSIHRDGNEIRSGNFDGLGLWRDLFNGLQDGRDQGSNQNNVN